MGWKTRGRRESLARRKGRAILTCVVLGLVVLGCEGGDEILGWMVLSLVESLDWGDSNR